MAVVCPRVGLGRVRGGRGSGLHLGRDGQGLLRDGRHVGEPGGHVGGRFLPRGVLEREHVLADLDPVPRAEQGLVDLAVVDPGPVPALEVHDLVAEVRLLDLAVLPRRLLVLDGELVVRGAAAEGDGVGKFDGPLDRAVADHDSGHGRAIL
jgi:hypothetical protein